MSVQREPASRSPQSFTVHARCRTSCRLVSFSSGPLPPRIHTSVVFSFLPNNTKHKPSTDRETTFPLRRTKNTARATLNLITAMALSAFPRPPVEHSVTDDTRCSCCFSGTFSSLVGASQTSDVLHDVPPEPNLVSDKSTTGEKWTGLIDFLFLSREIVLHYRDNLRSE